MRGRAGGAAGLSGGPAAGGVLSGGVFLRAVLLRGLGGGRGGGAGGAGGGDGAGPAGAGQGQRLFDHADLRLCAGGGGVRPARPGRAHQPGGDGGGGPDGAGARAGVHQLHERPAHRGHDGGPGHLRPGGAVGGGHRPGDGGRHGPVPGAARRRGGAGRGLRGGGVLPVRLPGLSGLLPRHERAGDGHAAVLSGRGGGLGGLPRRHGPGRRQLRRQSGGRGGGGGVRRGHGPSAQVPRHVLLHHRPVPAGAGADHLPGHGPRHPGGHGAVLGDLFPHLRHRRVHRPGPAAGVGGAGASTPLETVKNLSLFDGNLMEICNPFFLDTGGARCYHRAELKK